MFGGSRDGTKRMLSLEYEYKLLSKISTFILLSAEHTNDYSDSSTYIRDGFGIEGGLKFYPSRGRSEGLHIGGIIGGWYVDWEEKETISSSQGEIVQRDEGRSLALRVSSQIGYKLTIKDRFFVDPNFYFGYIEVPSELYIAIGLSTGIMW